MKSSTRDTHSLSSADGGTSKDNERMVASEATYQLSSVGGEVSKGHEESSQVRGTHVLPSRRKDKSGPVNAS
jgi:hypothetical protein